MVYTQYGPFTNGSYTPSPLSAQFLNGVETALLALNNVIPAPAPSGGDDTSVLQPLLLAAQATKGTLVLQAGTYKANLATAESFTQPRILGQGQNLTTLQATVNTSPALRFKGGSGQPAGGHFADFTITGTGGIGVEIADANAVTWTRIRVSGSFTEGWRFKNEAGFTEYCAGDAIIDAAVSLPVRYMVTSGTNSFHGTGFTRGTIINLPDTSVGPAIQVDAGAFPYSSPLTAAIFVRKNNAVVIRNNNGDSPSFFGHLDVEVQEGATGVQIADVGASRVLYQGTVETLITGSGARLGNLYRARSIYYQSGAAIADLEPYTVSTLMTSAPTAIAPLVGTSARIQVDISGANYHYAYVLDCWQSPYASTGTVSVISNGSTLNTAGYGPPAFSWTNYGLTVTNGSYTTALSAYVRVVPMATFPNQADAFRQ